MLNEMIEVIAKGVVERLLESTVLKDRIKAMVDEAVTSAVDDAVGEHNFQEDVRVAVEDAVGECKMEKMCEDAVEEYMRNFEMSTDNITDFEEAVRETIKGAL